MSPITWKPTERQVLVLAVSTFLLCVFLIEFNVLSYTKGVWVYPQDDAYIRMAIAKNVAFNHVWGVSKIEFSSAASTIGYPILLGAIYMIFGSHLVISFVVNFIAAIALLSFFQKWLIRERASTWSQLWIMLSLILLVPLPVLVVIGMEHVIQMLLSFLLIYGFCDWIEGEEARKIPRSILIFGALSTAIRYEGLFIVLIACVILVLRRRTMDAIKFGLISISPIVIFGIYSIAKGGYFLPNSILIKSMPIPFNWDNIKKFVSEDVVDKLLFPYPSRGGVAAERILIIIPLVFGIFWSFLKENRKYRYLLFFCLGGTILHMVFANTIFYYRYEAYLISCFVPVCGMVIVKGPKVGYSKKALGLVAISMWTAIVLFYPFVARSWDAYKDTGKGCINMYEQDYLAAQFLHRYYDRTTVIIDDLGAMSYLTEGRKMDLNAGIGNMEITRSKVEQYYRPDYLNYMVSKTLPEIAIVLERKYNPWLLNKWRKVGAWHTFNVWGPYGDKFISFYAVDSFAAPALKKRLEEFERYLPSGVKAAYYYDPVVMK